MKVLVTVQCGFDHDDLRRAEWVRKRLSPECRRAWADEPGTAVRELTDPAAVFRQLAELKGEGKLNGAA